METKDITQEYKTFLLSLEEKPLNIFLEDFKLLDDYKERELFLNTFHNKKIFNILIKEDFNKLFYLDSQANFILKELKLSDLDILKTLVYYYNTNSREFNKKIEEDNLKEDLLKKGFKEALHLIYKDKETKEDFNKRKEDYYKKLDGLKVKCVFDRDKIGILGSFTKKEEHEGKLIYTNNNIYFLPKRHGKTGQLLINKFYYKELK